jgi:hypothetical protein
MNNLAISLAGAIALGLLPAQNILLPDNHHLGESQAQVFASGSTSWWGTTTSLTGRHFQALYDASHFTGVGGVTGPVGITNLRFRGEDTEHNTGGQTFTGVTATIYSTSLASTAALSTTFATNTALGVSTLLGTVVIPTLTASASSGKAPNDFILDISFTVPTLPYDPTVSGPGSQPNFLVDIVYTAQTVGLPPELSTMIAIQDTAGGAVVVRGRGLFAATAIAATGTVSTAPPVIGVQISGAGGYATLLPARNERYGAGCGGAPSAFYQLFAHNEYFDLKDPGQVDGVVGLTLTPDTYPNPTFYTVTSGSAPVDVTNGIGGTPINIGEDATVAFGPIPAFQYPGGPAGGTTALRPSSNGYVILDPTSTETAADFSVSVDEFLGVTAATNVARLCPFWHDFSPQKNIGLDPLSGQYAVVNIANPAEVLVTWYRVGRFNSVAEPGQEYHTMQLSLNTSNGVVEFRYGAMDEIWGDTFTTSTVTGGMSGITGFTRGRIGAVPSVDPQSRDLSIERPFSTAVEGQAGPAGPHHHGAGLHPECVVEHAAVGSDRQSPCDRDRHRAVRSAAGGISRVPGLRAVRPVRDPRRPVRRWPAAHRDEQCGAHDGRSAVTDLG